MENIIIFIIIIIISSVISKNKKKQASQNTSGMPRTSSRPVSPQPVTDLRELLKTLKNINPETAGSKTFSDMKNRAEQVKPSGDEEYSRKDNYDANVPYEEKEKEVYTYDTSERNKESAEKSYEETGSYEDTSLNYEEKSGSVMSSIRRVPQADTSASNHKVHARIKIFETRSKIKSAIIASEILQRKYT